MRRKQTHEISEMVSCSMFPVATSRITIRVPLASFPSALSAFKAMPNFQN